MNTVLWANRKLRLLVTGQCNLECFYCHNEGQRKSSDFLSDDLFRHMVSVVRRHPSDLDKVTFSGGEPLLHSRLEHFVRELSPMPPQRTGVTNGLFLDQRRLDSLRNAGVTTFRVGADSLIRLRSRPSAVFPASQSIHNVLHLLEREGAPFELNVVLTQFNRDELPEILRFCRDHRVSAKFFEHVQVTFLRMEDLVMRAEAQPRLHFARFESALFSVLPDAIHVSADVFDGANEVYQCDGFSIRYCRYLCTYNLCHLTGTRIDSRGFVYACLVGNGRFRISSGQSVEDSARLVEEAVNWGCCSRSEQLSLV